MIVAAIVALSAVVLACLVASFDGIPALPDGVSSILSDVTARLVDAVGFVSCFFQWDVIKALVAFSVALAAVYGGYKLVMWVLRKVPMFGVS